MKTKIKVKSHIQRQREIYKNSRKFVQSRLKLSDATYQNEVLERGCEFLEDEFPIEISHNYYMRFATDTNYWKWFLSEWKQFEADYVADIEQAHLQFDFNEWHKELNHFVNSTVLYDSFHNTYLKTMYNGTV